MEIERKRGARENRSRHERFREISKQVKYPAAKNNGMYTEDY